MSICLLFNILKIFRLWINEYFVLRRCIVEVVIVYDVHLFFVLINVLIFYRLLFLYRSAIIYLLLINSERLVIIFLNFNALFYRWHLLMAQLLFRSFQDETFFISWRFINVFRVFPGPLYMVLLPHIRQLSEPQKPLLSSLIWGDFWRQIVGIT